MTIENWLETFSLILTITHFIVGWLIRLLMNKLQELSDMISKVEKQVDDHELYSAKTYTTKEDIKQVQDNLVGFLRRIEDRVNTIADKK